MTKKMTYVNAIENAINGNVDAATKERLQELIESLNRRNKKGGERKPTKTQRENAEMREDMVAWIGDAGPQTATQVSAHFTISNQKASSLLTAEVKAGRLVRFEEKRKAYFRVADGV